MRFLFWLLLTLPLASSAAETVIVAGRAGPQAGARADAEWIGTPGVIATDPAGGYYFSTGTPISKVFRVAANGVLTSFAGPGIYPNGMALDASGNIVFTERGRIRRIARDGTITDIAGNGTPG